MVKKSIHLLCLFVVFALSANASAELIVYEGFVYLAGGTIGGNNGGSGWDQPWTGGNTVLSPGLDYGGLPVVGNTGVITGPWDNPSFRMMPSGFNALNRTLWISFLSQEISAAGYAGFSTFYGETESLFLGSIWDTEPPRYWGVRVYNALNDTGVEEGPAFVSAIETTEKVFFVARIVNGPSSARMTLWVNPGLEAEPGSGDAWFDEIVGRIPFDRIRLNCYADEGVTVRYDFDEIRIGESYADVIMAPGATKATNPSPVDCQQDVSPEVVLKWRPGVYVAGLSPKHRVFFSENFDDVNDGIGGIEQDVELYPVDGTLNLDFDKTYYWRVDEANNTTGWDVGDVWEFTVADYIVVDDFEDYSIDANQIWCSWKEGIGYTDPEDYHGNGTGSAVGDDTTDSTTEETIVHGGTQSMPYTYVNDGTSTNIFGEPIVEYYSEAELTFSSPQDWTRKGVKALSLWFRGYPAYLSSFSEDPPGTYTIVGEGADISGESDQFHFAWKELSGAGSITAKVESVQNTHEFAKAGVMIRNTLDGDSAHAMVAVTPGNGVWFGRRTEAGITIESDSQYGITAPYWVKLERTAGGLMRANYSADGSSWTQLGTSDTVSVSTPMYIGLAVSSHNPGVTCEAKFSNITSDGTGDWINEDIGMYRNEAEPIYIVISDTTSTTGTVYHEDPNAAIIDTWTEWNINLKDFADLNVDLNDINSIAIGFGNRVNPQAGGSGKMYFDDIRLYPPRCVPSLLKPAGDLNNDCVVNCLDLEIMTNDWLQGDYAVAATIPEPGISWWQFENNTNDSIGDNHGIVKGNPAFVAGKSGQAISLDGVDDYVDCGNTSVLDFGTGDWTISAWIMTTQSGTGDDNKGTVFAKGGDHTDGIRYTLAVNEQESGEITLTTDDNTTKAYAASSVLVNDGAWHHVVGMRIGNELRVYVDGLLGGTNTVPDGYDLSGTSQHNAYIGVITDNRYAIPSKYYAGLIDDVQIHDYALSHTDIIGAAGLTELYYPLISPANISDEEPNTSKVVNFKDFAVLAVEWLEQQLIWPEQ
ncbi:MAG: LamG domain-containing protein [Planctomycetota bacterium]|jgi:hypothetical protein